MIIYCCGCKQEIEARLTDGAEVYPHRIDLHRLPFWKCDACGNFVGCHHKTKNRTQPLGCIPTREIKDARMMLHRIIDPLWKSKQISRAKLYKMISRRIGKQYHTAEIRSVDEANSILSIAKQIKQEIAQ